MLLISESVFLFVYLFMAFWRSCCPFAGLVVLMALSVVKAAVVLMDAAVRGRCDGGTMFTCGRH